VVFQHRQSRMGFGGMWYAVPCSVHNIRILEKAPHIGHGFPVKSSLLLASALAGSDAALCSMNGSLRDLSVASVDSLRSLTLTINPASAKAGTRVTPTWPAPPTTVTSAVFAQVGPDGAVLVDAIFNWFPCRRCAQI
jgi:hypothetical protein